MCLIIIGLRAFSPRDYRMRYLMISVQIKYSFLSRSNCGRLLVYHYLYSIISVGLLSGTKLEPNMIGCINFLKL